MLSLGSTCLFDFRWNRFPVRLRGRRRGFEKRGGVLKAQWVKENTTFDDHDQIHSVKMKKECIQFGQSINRIQTESPESNTRKIVANWHNTTNTVKKTIDQRLTNESRVSRCQSKSYPEKEVRGWLGEPNRRTERSQANNSQSVTTNQTNSNFTSHPPNTSMVWNLKGIRAKTHQKGVFSLVEDSIPPLVPQTIITIPNHWYTYPVAQ